MWLGITDITTFVVGTIIIVLLPGPNSLYVMTVASRQGVAPGYRGAMGIVVGDTVLMLLSVLGVAGVLKAFPAVFVVLQYAGAAYLAWLGVQLCRAGWRQWHEQTHRGEPLPGPQRELEGPVECSGESFSSAPPVRAQRLVSSEPHGDTAHRGNPFRTALLISLMNPKAILFFVSFFIQFVSPSYAYPALSFLVLGLIVQVCSITYLSALIWGGAGLAGYFGRRRKLSAASMGLVGLLFVAFGVRLAQSGLG
jgi:leucine efflux protein